MSVLRMLLTIMVSGVLAACALSPQQVELDLNVSGQGERYGAGRPVEVVVEDQRSNPVIGTRGGVYAETSRITLADELTDTLARAASARLAADGFNVNSGAGDAAELRVLVEKLSYDVVEGKPALHDVELEAILGVEVRRGGDSYRGRYQTKTSRSFVAAPSREKNAEVISQVLEETLERLFADPKLREFLTARGSLL